MRRIAFFTSLAIFALPETAFAQAAAAPVADTATAVMEISGPKLRVSDIDRAIKFYEDGLGLTLVRRIGTSTAVLSSHGKAPPPLIVLVQDSKPIVIGDGMSAVMLNVSDPAAAWARLKAAGYVPTERSRSGVFFVKDPDGYTFEVTQSRPAPRQ